MAKNLNNLSEKEQLAAVQKDGLAIYYIKNPSKAVQLAAIRKNALAICNIKNPNETVRLAAVQEYGWTVVYIDNPSEQVQLASLEWLFKYNIELPKNITSQKAINKWKKLHIMEETCD